MSTVTAKDIMSSSPLITVTPDASLQEIARILTDYPISGVPVVTEEGKLVGIVSEADLLPKEAGDPSGRSLFGLKRLSDFSRSSKGRRPRS